MHCVINAPQVKIDKTKVEVPSTTPITISVIQPYWPFAGDLIVNSPYTAIRIGEYYWMDKNLNDSIPAKYAEPWNSGTAWTGIASLEAITQESLDADMDRLFIDKSQFQIEIDHFNEYYGRYYTRTDVEYFARGNNLTVLEGEDGKQTAWKVPKNEDYRQLFAMCLLEDWGKLRCEQPLATKKMKIHWHMISMTPKEVWHTEHIGSNTAPMS